MRLGFAGFLAAALLNAACSSSSPAEPTSAWLRKTKVTDLATTGATTLLAIGQTSQLTAKVNSPQGPLTVTKNVTWISADPAIATVSPTGLATATGFGTTKITANLDGSEVTQQIDVLAATGLTMGSTSPDGSILRSGVLTFPAVARTAQLILTGTWPGGITRNVTADATWTSLDAVVATISSSGVLRSNGFGSTTVVARYQSVTLSTPVAVTPTVTSLTIQGSLNLNTVGETSALTVLARFTDTTIKEVSDGVAWTTSNAAVVTVSPTGVLTAVGLGKASISVTYLGRTFASPVTVSPAGTFVINGRARDPGNGQEKGLGVPGFAIRDLQTGRSTVTDATGNYELVAVAAGDRLRFEKDGWESAELVINKATDEGSPAVQRVVRITAGETVAIETAPNDLLYDLAPGISCSPCRLIRVVSPTAGTLHLVLTWTGSLSPRLSLWTSGQAFNATTTAPIRTVADLPVSAGETLLYAGLIGGEAFATGYLNLTLTTSFTAAPIASSARPSRKE